MKHTMLAVIALALGNELAPAAGVSAAADADANNNIEGGNAAGEFDFLSLYVEERDASIRAQLALLCPIRSRP